MMTYRASPSSPVAWFVGWFALLISSVSLAQPTINVGFVVPYPAGEEMALAEEATREKLEAALEGQVRTTLVTGIDSAQALETALEQLTEEKYALVFITGPYEAKTVSRLVKQYPEVRFEWESNTPNQSNLATYQARLYYAYYLAGSLAAKASTSKRLGIIVERRDAATIRLLNAFALGARQATPRASVRVGYQEHSQGRRGAAGMIDQLMTEPVDVLLIASDDSEITPLAEAKNLPMIRAGASIATPSSPLLMASIETQWGSYYLTRIKALIAGQWKSQKSWIGLNLGAVALNITPQSVPEPVRRSVQQAEADLVLGEIDPFAGPIDDQQGRQVIGAGYTLTDAEIMSMDWYVSGVSEF